MAHQTIFRANNSFRCRILTQMQVHNSQQRIIGLLCHAGACILNCNGFQQIDGAGFYGEHDIGRLVAFLSLNDLKPDSTVIETIGSKYFFKDVDIPLCPAAQTSQAARLLFLQLNQQAAGAHRVFNSILIVGKAREGYIVSIIGQQKGLGMGNLHAGADTSQHNENAKYHAFRATNR